MTNQLSTDDIDTLASIDVGFFHIPSDGTEEPYERALHHGLVEVRKFRMSVATGVRLTQRGYRRTPKGDAFVKALAEEMPNV